MSLGRNSVLILTLIAVGAVIARTFVTAAGAQATAAGNALGVAREDADDGTPFSADCQVGVTEVIAGAAIAADTLVEVDASGYAVTLDTGKAVARTMEAASGAGVVVRVALLPN